MKMGRFWILVCFSVVGCTEFPNPQREWRMCGRPKPSFVCDPDFILERGDAERLDQIAMEFRRSTACMCSNCPGKVGVSLGIYLKNNVTQEALLKYPSGRALSEMLRRRWSLSPCDSDIVIVLLTQQNISDFSMGKAVQTIFPETTALQIIRECRVHFDSGWYYQGLESIANSFNDVIVKLQKQPRPTFKNLMLGIGLGFGTMLVLALVALFLLHRQSRKRRNTLCEDIYEGIPGQKNQRRSSFEQEEHLEKLRKLNTSDEEEEDDGTSCTQYEFHRISRSQPSVHFMSMQRQLSDVTEESSEDSELMNNRNSFHASSFSSSQYSPRRNSQNIPVTEL